jgi:hypothetical protein
MLNYKRLPLWGLGGFFFKDAKINNLKRIFYIDFTLSFYPLINPTETRNYP